jgi:hypothetical protein
LTEFNPTEHVRRMCGAFTECWITLSLRELPSFFLSRFPCATAFHLFHPSDRHPTKTTHQHSQPLSHARTSATVALAMSATGAAASKAHLVSFQGPFGSSGSIHGWKFMGSAVVTESYVRLTPAEVCALVCVCVCVLLLLLLLCVCVQKYRQSQTEAC